MFVSFFPRPLTFAISAVLWGAFAIGFWYTFGSQIGELLGFHLQVSETKTVGAAVFWSSPIPVVLSLFCRDCYVVRVGLDAFVPSPVVAMVDPRIRLDPVHCLLPGSG
jgi:ABC-type long-subunit fatty acid transport system fused permease/ATPase subunit